MNPVLAAWIGAGSPAPAEHPTQRGRCSRCLDQAALVPTARVVSENFTGYGAWLGDPGRGLCPACTWCYRNPQLRAQAHQVTQAPATLTAMPLPRLRSLLAKPLTPAVAVTVPLRANRKHVLPDAVWGRVVVDGTVISWTLEDAQLLKVLEGLRAAGVPGSALAAASPPWKVVGSLPAKDRALVMSSWDSLQPWRARRPWLDLAVLATTTSRSSS